MVCVCRLQGFLLFFDSLTLLWYTIIINGKINDLEKREMELMSFELLPECFRANENVHGGLFKQGK